MLSYEKLAPLITTSGTHKVKYHADEEWDFLLDESHKSVDLSLVLPHYRARHQPIEHRMNMYVRGQGAPLKLKVCRNTPQSKFYLDIRAASSNVTVWLPSDFRGRVHHTGRAVFSAGFVNRIMQHVRLNDAVCNDISEEDEVVVCTRGQITFRMWDVQTRMPENPQKEAFRRLFGCTRKSPTTTFDWDFLLED